MQAFLHKITSNSLYATNDLPHIVKVWFLFQDSGTARPIQRKLTSQLQSETESAEDKAKHTEHLELSAELTKLLLPVLLEVRIIFGVFLHFGYSLAFFDDFWHKHAESRVIVACFTQSLLTLVLLESSHNTKTKRIFRKY